MLVGVANYKVGGVLKVGVTLPLKPPLVRRGNTPKIEANK